MRSNIRAAWAVLLLVMPATVRADQQTVTWLGGNGNWSDGTKWTGGVVPNNVASTTYAVNIDGGKASASNVWDYTASVNIDSLSIDAGDTLTVESQSQLQINQSLSLQGTIIAAGASNPAQVLLPANSIVASGTLSASGRSNIAVSSGSLTLDGNVMIVGSPDSTEYFSGMGMIGSTSTVLVNHTNLSNTIARSSVVFAGSRIDNGGTFTVGNQSVVAFETDSTLAGLGTLVNNGGQFWIAGTLENAGQTFRVDLLSGGWTLCGTIRGGSIETGDGMALSVPYSSVALLDDVEINGKVSVLDRLQVPAGQAFKGTGEIFIPAGSGAPEGSGAISAADGNTIIGSGLTIDGGTPTPLILNILDDPQYIGGNTLINHGKIIATPSNSTVPSFILNLRGKTITNDGTFGFSPKTRLTARGNVLFLSGGTLLVDGGGEFDVVAGSLDLTTVDDLLKVMPQAGGDAYDHMLIATYTGSLSGIFDSVTPGITVDYSTPGEIFISGTPVPEPGMLSATFAIMAGGLLCRRRLSAA